MRGFQAWIAYLRIKKMVSLKLDNQNNLIFKNNFMLVENKEAIIQDIKNLLLMFETEYPFDLTMGIPYYELAKNNNSNIIKNTIKERILEDTRVESITSLEVSFKGGKLQISAELNTSEGVVNV